MAGKVLVDEHALDESKEASTTELVLDPDGEGGRSC